MVSSNFTITATLNASLGDTRVLIRGESSYDGLYQTYRTPAVSKY